MHNILLVIDGSADSLAAVNVAISLTKQVPQSQVLALYVLDTPAVWNFLGAPEPGLIGSGPYFQACESIKNSLRDLAETVVDSYRARCNNVECFAQVIVDEGAWLDKVAERAKMLQPLILVGNSILTRISKEANLTVSEIANYLSYPMVVVDRTALSSACFPVLASKSVDGGAELNLSLPETAFALIARAESLPHAA